MTKTKAILVVVLAALVGAAAAWAGSTGAISFPFVSQAPSSVMVRRACYPGTQDAVYVSRATDASGEVRDSQLWVVPGGCPIEQAPGPVTNSR